MKKLIQALNSINDNAFGILIGTLQTCCMMVFCAFIILVHIGAPSPRVFNLYMLALELALSPVGVLLVGNLAAAIAEELFGNR